MMLIDATLCPHCGEESDDDELCQFCGKSMSLSVSTKQISLRHALKDTLNELFCSLKAFIHPMTEEDWDDYEKNPANDINNPAHPIWDKLYPWDKP